MPKQKITLNKDQKKAIQHQKGPILVVAGAGTGKTRVITERIRYLIQDKKVQPQEILALTFTDKAAAEMLDRIGDIMPLGYEEPWVSTFHAFADRILRTEGLEIGLDPGFKVISTPEQWILLRKNLFKLDLKYFRPLGNPTKFISGVLKFISRLQDENIAPEEFSKYIKSKKDWTDDEEKQRWEELDHMYTKYQEIKLENSKLDFGDMITWAIKLFETRPNILKKYQEQFKHVLVDEFQDTNYAQYVLVKLLCPKTLGDRSLLVVGDDSQSIYKFRGAAVSNILEFMKDYPKAEMVTLLKNYRSTQEILDPAYKLIKNNNPDTLESKLGISKELKSEHTNVKNAEDPKILQTETLEDEVELVISKIYEILAKEPQYTYKDFAILARANSHLDPFVMGLRQHGLPYQLVGNRGLYDREEVRDIVALLRAVINPEDTLSLYRVLNIDSLNISYEKISELLSGSRTKKVSMWELITKSKDKKINSLYETFKEFQEKITKSTPVEFVFDLVHSTNYLDQYIKEESVENQLSIKNMDLFLNKVKKFELDYHNENKEFPTIIDFLDYLELLLEAGDSPAQAEIEDIDTINLLTVHSSKGLEFPVVFMIDLASDRFPTRNRRDIIEIPDELIKETLPTGDEHTQEERRLFYVGMTRAEKYLHMTLAKDYGGKREKRPSGFLNETGLEINEVKPNQIKHREKQSSLFGTETQFRDPGAQKIKDFKPDFLSYSQIDTYLSCPLKYKYSYVLRIPTRPNHALSFGVTIHDTLRDFHQRMLFEDVDFDDVLKMYEKNWQPLGYINEEHRKTRFESGKELLKNYYEKHSGEKIKPIALEKPFNIMLNGIRFYGRIDRIDPLKVSDKKSKDKDGDKSEDKESKKVEIIDYKTGQKKSQRDVDKDLQVSLYALGVEQALKLDPAKMSLYFVEDGEKISTTRTDKQLEDAKKEVMKVVEKIKDGGFEATPGMHCNFCDFREICPFVWRG